MHAHTHTVLGGRHDALSCAREVVGHSLYHLSLLRHPSRSVSQCVSTLHAMWCIFPVFFLSFPPHGTRRTAPLVRLLICTVLPQTVQIFLENRCSWGIGVTLCHPVNLCEAFYKGPTSLLYMWSLSRELDTPTFVNKSPRYR
jgi:hypothetical protein